MSEAGHGLHWVRSRLGYVPRDPSLFELALTHRSAANRNYERLEFLGDAVLNLLVADHLYRKFPDADEGALSRLRASLVSGASLARIAGSLQLGDAVALGAGELKTGGFRRESILADAFEAVCGAVYLDAGIEVARPILLQVLGDALMALDEPSGAKDAKTQLQEWLQGRGLPLPRYHVESVHGESHAQTFRVSCRTDSPAEQALGEGSSRRRGEQAAAQQVLERIMKKASPDND